MSEKHVDDTETASNKLIKKQFLIKYSIEQRAAERLQQTLKLRQEQQKQNW